MERLNYDRERHSNHRGTIRPEYQPSKRKLRGGEGEKGPLEKRKLPNAVQDHDNTSSSDPVRQDNHRPGRKRGTRQPKSEYLTGGKEKISVAGELRLSAEPQVHEAGGIGGKAAKVPIK